MPAAGGPYEALTAADRLRNARARHEAADRLLNAAWKQAKAEVGAEGFPALQKGQREWLEYRDSMTERVSFDALRHAGKAEDPDAVDFKSSPEYWHQLTSQTVDRTPVLRAWSGKNVAPGRSGIYRDSYGGELTLEEKKDGLHFEINVVRGPTFHVGGIAGTAKLKGEAATWTDAPSPEGEKAAVLRFKFNASRSLTVESENAGSYHGVRAYFDGEYFKTAPFEKEPPSLEK